MVASRESFSSLQINDGISIDMGDNTQIQAKGKHHMKKSRKEKALATPPVQVEQEDFKAKNDPDLCRNATEYTNNHRNKYATEITLHFINQ